MTRYIEELTSYLEIVESLKEAAMVVRVDGIPFDHGIDCLLTFSVLRYAAGVSLAWSRSRQCGGEVIQSSAALDDGMCAQQSEVYDLRSIYLTEYPLAAPLSLLQAFTWGLLVTWNWNNLPAFLAFAVGWILLATNEQMRQHPSRWQKCPPYNEIFERWLYNAAISETIAADTNLDDIIAYDKSVEEHRQQREMEKQKEAEHEAALQKELLQEIEQAEAAEQLHLKNYIYFGMAFSFLVEMLNMIMRKRQAKNRVVQLNQPLLKEETENYSDQAK